MRSSIVRFASYSLGISMMIFFSAGNLLAGTNRVPEIDPGSISVGLGLLTAGLLILRSRRRSK